MKRLIAMLLAVLILFSIAACSDGGTEPGGAETPAPEYADEAFGCSAWLCYWDAETALREAREHADSFESLVCFEAFFDAEGNILLPPESEALLAEMQTLDTPIYLSLVNDVQQPDGSYVQKSRDFLAQELSTPAARSAHIAKIMQLVRARGVTGLEIDYENFKKDTELWSAFTEFIGQLYSILSHNGVSLRVVMECGAPEYAVFPEGPVYICMCYNLYGYHSGPGPKADRAFLEKLGESWKAVPGEVHMAFASGGFLWAVDKVEKALTEQDAQSWLEQAREKAKRDPDSGALKTVVYGGKKQSVWFADGETLALWRDTLRAMGYTHFDLFRLGGNTSESLAAFLGEA